MLKLTKENEGSSHFQPLESGWITLEQPCDKIEISDGQGRRYLSQPVSGQGRIPFKARGTAGWHRICLRDDSGGLLHEWKFLLKARTSLHCPESPYQKIFEVISEDFHASQRRKPLAINGKTYPAIVGWSRDHALTLKSMKYFMDEVKEGTELWLDTQNENGMFWDCFHINPENRPNWFCEALGEGWFTYYNDKKLQARRIPVEADVEYCITEAVYHGWKSSGDKNWMEKQLPKLEAALEYNTSDPLRWSRKNQLVKRAFCMDNWDFTNPHYCNGDHRCINEGDPFFLFHGDNSGLYSMYWRMAEMYEAVGNSERAADLREEGEALRNRINEKLYFDHHYGHMIPDELDEDEVYALVGDERERMSLSTGYTLNRKVPTHDMVVEILREYQRRRDLKKNESFAEWWTMDPPYEADQWPSGHNGQGFPWGEYMNGAICHIASGELAKAAFDHGMEAYGDDILNRVWKLTERDGNHMHEAYSRMPEKVQLAETTFTPLDFTEWARDYIAQLTRLCADARDNPNKFGAIEFDVIDPSSNQGRSALLLTGADNPVDIDARNQSAQSLYFLHAAAVKGSKPHDVIAVYRICYTDGTEVPAFIKLRHEIGGWWGPQERYDKRGDPLDTQTTRIAWSGPNPCWKDVGVYMYGWDNPHPGKNIASVRIDPTPMVDRPNEKLLLMAISLSAQPVQYEVNIRSFGLPACWAESSVMSGLLEGLCGVEDQGDAFSEVQVSPRWVQTGKDSAEVCVHYPASDGYCAYQFQYSTEDKEIALDLTGSFQKGLVRVLLPAKSEPEKISSGANELPFSLEKIEDSLYARIQLDKVPEDRIVIKLS